MIEQMTLYHGSRFVALAYHNYNNDGMTCIESVPFSFSGAPTCSLNRNQGVDPDLIPAMWEKAAENPSIADVECDLEWADDEHTLLKATARVRFINDIEANGYLFSIALAADGLSNERWAQSNGYGSYEMSDAYSSPYWDLFIGKGSPVFGLEFNDVIVHSSDFKGVAGSLPESIEAEKWYEFTYEIPIAEVLTLDGKEVVKNFDKTRAVAIVVDSATANLSTARLPSTLTVRNRSLCL